ncbi:hypothetical protein N2W52_002065 [Clostridium perfringens]|nr:hypothetical protein [Clostridium perfringens]MDK0983082.1 hypothetical protein [Clostridium perfringens]
MKKEIFKIRKNKIEIYESKLEKLEDKNSFEANNLRAEIKYEKFKNHRDYLILNSGIKERSKLIDEICLRVNKDLRYQTYTEFALFIKDGKFKIDSFICKGELEKKDYEFLGVWSFYRADGKVSPSKLRDDFFIEKEN